MRYIAIGIMAAAALAAGAQELNESFQVEGEYKPDVIIRERVFSLPDQLSFTMETTPLTYSVRGVPATFAPDFLNLPPTGWRASRTPAARKGYVELQMGSWLQSNLSAGYRFVDTPKTILGAYLQFNSTSLWKPYKEIAGAEDEKRKLYDGTLGVYGSHDIGSAGTLSGLLNYRAGYFNYYGVAGEAPTQTLHQVNASVGIDAKPRTEGADYHAQAGYTYFGYRDLPALTAGGDIAALPGERESQAWLDAEGGYCWEEGSRVGLGLTARSVAYNDMALAPKAYGNAGVNPYYRFQKGDLNIRLGAQVDFTMNARDEWNDRFGTVHIAPDVSLDYRRGPLGVYLYAKGGVQLQTLEWCSQLDYYQMPLISSTLPVRTPIDGKLGLNFGPFSGFSMGLSFGYKITDHVLYRGVYSLWLNGLLPASNDLPAREGYLDIKGYQIGMDASYELGSLIKVYFQGTYSPQKGETGYFNGYDRPRWVLHTGIEARPVSRLRVALDYEYRGVRNVWYKHSTEDFLLQQYRLSDLTLLGLSAEYDITSRISATAALYNLLGCKADILPSLPQAGTNFLLGLQLKL